MCRPFGRPAPGLEPMTHWRRRLCRPAAASCGTVYQYSGSAPLRGWHGPAPTIEIQKHGLRVFSVGEAVRVSQKMIKFQIIFRIRVFL